jgi:hypothetical protein
MEKRKIELVAVGLVIIIIIMIIIVVVVVVVVVVFSTIAISLVVATGAVVVRELCVIIPLRRNIAIPCGSRRCRAPEHYSPVPCIVANVPDKLSSAASLIGPER